MNKADKPFKRLLSLVLCLIVLSCSLSACSFNLGEIVSTTLPESDVLTVHYIDVDQGDSSLITFPDGKTMLIDGGPQYNSYNLINYISNLGIETIDLLVATHPHEDHIGGLADVLENFTVGEVFMPNISEADTPTTRVYEHFLTAVLNEGCAVNEAKAGTIILKEEGITAECISPNGTDYGNLNLYSAVIRLQFNDIKFLFMADAEAKNESQIISDGYDIDADILKIGHHGSTTSSSKNFIKNVSPTVGIISCGEGNRYGHPHDEILDLYDDMGTDVYRTDLNGTVKVECKGNNYTVSQEK